MTRQQRWEHQYKCFCENLEADRLRFSENRIVVSEEDRWRYAIPENYTNYQDGFLEQDGDFYKGRPVLNYNGKILYFYRDVKWYGLADDEVEKLYLFDRHGQKYTFVVKKSGHNMPDGNPSYYDFLPRVKKYQPTRKILIRQKLAALREKMKKDAQLPAAQK